MRTPPSTVLWSSVTANRCLLPLEVAPHGVMLTMVKTAASSGGRWPLATDPARRAPRPEPPRPGCSCSARAPKVPPRSSEPRAQRSRRSCTGRIPNTGHCFQSSLSILLCAAACSNPTRSLARPSIFAEIGIGTRSSVCRLRKRSDKKPFVRKCLFEKSWLIKHACWISRDKKSTGGLCEPLLFNCILT